MTGTAGKMKWQQEGNINPLDSNTALSNAALTAFSTHSFGEASLNDIIKTAGLNKGSFYYRFYDKMDLYLSLIHQTSTEKLAIFKQYDDSNTGDTFFDSIKQKAMLGLRFANKEPRYNEFNRRILAEETSVREAIRVCFQDVTQDVLTSMVEDAKTRGQLRTDISTQLITDVFSVLLERIDLMIEPTMDDVAILEKVEELITILRDGIAIR